MAHPRFNRLPRATTPLLLCFTPDESRLGPIRRFLFSRWLEQPEELGALTWRKNAAALALKVGNVGPNGIRKRCGMLEFEPGRAVPSLSKGKSGNCYNLERLDFDAGLHLLQGDLWRKVAGNF